MLNLVLFGAPGCGKGTQAQRLEAHYGLAHVSTGEVIRGEIRRGTALGKSMEACIARGQLASDEIVIGMIDSYVAAHRDVAGNIFDGFPRTTAQAEAFDVLMARYGLQVDVMIDMHVPEDELVRRILLRGLDSGRADDASEEVIRRRIEVYHDQTAIVAAHYRRTGKYCEVDGTGTMDEVFARLCGVIDRLRGGI